MGKKGKMPDMNLPIWFVPSWGSLFGYGSILAKNFGFSTPQTNRLCFSVAFILFTVALPHLSYRMNAKSYKKYKNAL